MSSLDQEPLPDWLLAIERERRKHAARLRPGVRVRVRLSECPWPYHNQAENGACGTVQPIPAHSRLEAEREKHPIGVIFDWPGIEVDGVCWWGSGYAASELEPLTDAPAPAPEGRE